MDSKRATKQQYSIPLGPKQEREPSPDMKRDLHPNLDAIKKVP